MTTARSIAFRAAPARSLARSTPGAARAIRRRSRGLSRPFAWFAWSRKRSASGSMSSGRARSGGIVIVIVFRR